MRRSADDEHISEVSRLLPKPQSPFKRDTSAQEDAPNDENYEITYQFTHSIPFNGKNNLMPEEFKPHIDKAVDTRLKSFQRNVTSKVVRRIRGFVTKRYGQLETTIAEIRLTGQQIDSLKENMRNITQMVHKNRVDIAYNKNILVPDSFGSDLGVLPGLNDLPKLSEEHSDLLLPALNGTDLAPLPNNNEENSKLCAELCKRTWVWENLIYSLNVGVH